MKTQELTQILGPVIQEQIICGRYGNALHTANSFILADPCYIFPRDTHTELSRHGSATFGSGNFYKIKEWTPLPWQGHTIYFKNTEGDGSFPVQFDNGDTYHLCVDAGWLAAIPTALVPQNIREIFNLQPLQA